MTKAYRILAYLIAAEVVIQAAVITLASFGFSKWIDNGGVADLATFSSGNLDFFGSIGYELHGTNGALYIPILSIAFLVLSLFARSIRGGVIWAAIVFGLVALQVFLGFASHSFAVLGPLHGVNAFALFVCALHAGRRVSAHVRAAAATSTVAADEVGSR
jgi:hypothetical protein